MSNRRRWIVEASVNSRTGSASAPSRIISPSAPTEKSPDTAFTPECRPVKLFKSYRAEYKDGGQLRDFVYVKDCVRVVIWLLANPQVNGLFNLGTGKARSFADLAQAAFAAVGKPPAIQYIDMPEEIRDKYQYFTEASMDRLRAAGYKEAFHSLEDGVKDYVVNYLNKDDQYF